jgi:hypothetical protein
MRPEAKTLSGVNVLSSNLLRRDVLAPVRYEAVGCAECDLDNERTSVAVELEAEEIDLRLADSAKVRKRSGKPHIAKNRNNNFAQGCNHLVA